MPLQCIPIVDDDPRILNVLRQWLSYARYQVGEAPNGEATLAAVLAHPSDLVILDLLLPGLDGVEIGKRPRAWDTLLPIVMLTAKGSLSGRIEGLDAGADYDLVKPFVHDELLAHLRALHRRRES